jgi:hypothetical protein
MKIKLSQPPQGMKSETKKIGVGGTFISPNLVKKSVVVNKDGDYIDLATKKVIKRRGEPEIE